MDQPARLYLCARCRIQVVLCSYCDRGNRYCGRACRRLARAEARRQTVQRYQRSWRGRLAHAQRSRRWRQRRAAAAAGPGSSDAHNVTHQGSQPGVAAAPLVAWTHDSVTVGLARSAAEQAGGTTAETTVTSAPPKLAIAATCWRCRRCGCRQPAALRLGFLRRGVPAWRRHDHDP
ncbi:MAG TPA: hypothetical protein PK221_09365 [Ottowia sp.]|nr:hypothetical protein [Ottowia sp.]HPP98563.1 hypothetical protein [Ottowia sp.]